MTAQPPDPLDMRAAVAAYVEQVHAAYLAQADTFPPAVRGRMALLSGGRLTVVAAGVRHLHLIGTREALGPLRGQEVEMSGELPGFDWTLRFYDPIVVPALGLIEEPHGPAITEVRHALGLGTVVYHLALGLPFTPTPHHAGHVGFGLANSDSRVARDFETIRSRVRGRERLVDELEGAAHAGLPRAQALLARAIAPRDTAVAELADSPDPDPNAVRKALLAHVSAGAGP